MTATSAYGSWEACHTGPANVLTIGEACIWAGSWKQMNDDLEWDLRIRFNDGFLRGGDTLIRADERAQSILGPAVTRVTYPPTIDVDWEDFGTPPLEASWWRALVAAFKKMGPASVAIYCQGGHGRTGTALSILAALDGQVPDKMDPVGFIRSKYCHEAVESYAQVNYIQQITNRVVHMLPTSALKLKGGHNYSDYGQAHPYGEWEVDIRPSMVYPKKSPITPETTMLDPKNKVLALKGRK